jgi:hypothetical protein
VEASLNQSSPDQGTSADDIGVFEISEFQGLAARALNGQPAGCRGRAHAPCRRTTTQCPRPGAWSTSCGHDVPSHDVGQNVNRDNRH